MRSACACGRPLPTPGAAQCRECRRAYMRRWRRHPLVTEAMIEAATSALIDAASSGAHVRAVAEATIRAALAARGRP